MKSYRHEAKKWVGGLEVNFYERSLCKKLATTPALHSKAVLKHFKPLIVSFLLTGITITVSFQHECSSEFVKEYVSPVNIMKGHVSLIMKGVYYQ